MRLGWMYGFLVVILIVLFSYGCRKDIKTIEEYYEYVDINDYARDSFPDAITLNGGIYLTVKEKGTGIKPVKNDKIYVFYKGCLLTGQEFDSREKFKEVDGKDSIQMPFSFYFQTGSVIAGWDSAFAHLQRGSKATILIPSDLAYGNISQSKIPPNSPLRFDVDLLWIVGDTDSTDISDPEIDDTERIMIKRLLGLIE